MLDRVLLSRFNTRNKLHLYTQSTPLFMIRRIRIRPFLFNLIDIINTSLYLQMHLRPHRFLWNPIHTPRFLSLGIITWEHNNRYSPLCDKRRQSRIHTAPAPTPAPTPAPMLPTTILPQPRLVSRDCIFLNMPMARIYLSIMTLMCESERTRKANLPCSPPRFPVFVWPTKQLFSRLVC